MTKPDDPGNHGAKPRDINIEVNSKPVTVQDRDMLGAEIKQSAFDQGVQIQLNFVLQLEQPNGTSKVIGDADPVRVHNHMSFTAIAPDDNS